METPLTPLDFARRARKLYPRREAVVEGALLRHPAILEVAVVGMPHEKWGEAPPAFVVMRPDVSVTEAELRDFARGALAHFKVPSAFHFVNELLKTGTGKIQKFVLRGRRTAIARQ